MIFDHVVVAFAAWVTFVAGVTRLSFSDPDLVCSWYTTIYTVAHDVNSTAVLSSDHSITTGYSAGDSSTSSLFSAPPAPSPSSASSSPAPSVSSASSTLTSPSVSSPVGTSAFSASASATSGALPPIFRLQALGTNNIAIEGRYLVLVPNGDGNYHGEFTAAQATAQQFIIGPNSALKTADSQLVAAVPYSANQTLTDQLFVPESTPQIFRLRARQAASTTLFFDACKGNSNSSLSCGIPAWSQGIFQISFTGAVLQIGSQIYGIPLNLYVLPIIVPSSSNFATASSTPASSTSTSLLIPFSASSSLSMNYTASANTTVNPLPITSSTTSSSSSTPPSSGNTSIYSTSSLNLATSYDSSIITTPEETSPLPSSYPNVSSTALTIAAPTTTPISMSAKSTGISISVTVY